MAPGVTYRASAHGRGFGVARLDLAFLPVPSLSTCARSLFICTSRFIRVFSPCPSVPPMQLQALADTGDGARAEVEVGVTGAGGSGVGAAKGREAQARSSSGDGGIAGGGGIAGDGGAEGRGERLDASCRAPQSTPFFTRLPSSFVSAEKQAAGL
jgi:hypothetical protein